MQVESRRDIRLVERAMRAGWNVPDETKRTCISQLEAIARDAEAKDSDKVAAIKALMTADDIDQKHEANEHSRRLQLLELARRIDPGALAKHASSHGIPVANINVGDDGSGG